MLEAAKRKKMQTGKTIEDITLNPSETSRYSQTPRQDKEATRINATDLLEPQRNKTANIVPLVTPNSKNEQQIVDEQDFSSVSSSLFQKKIEHKTGIENMTLQPSGKLDFFHQNQTPRAMTSLGTAEVIEEQRSEAESPGTPRQRTPPLMK